MKKLVSVILTVCLFACLCVPALAEEESGAITWYMQGMTEGENFVAGDMGMVLEMIPVDDMSGTVILSYGDESSEGTFTVIDSEAGTLEITIDDETVNCILDQEQMMLGLEYEEGSYYVFGLTPAVVLPEAVMAEDASAFEGDWQITAVYVEGMAMSLDTQECADMLDMFFGSHDAALSIADGKASYFGQEVEVAFEDGVLAFHSDDSDLSQLLDVVITLREDGSITLEQMGILFICI